MSEANDNQRGDFTVPLRFAALNTSPVNGGGKNAYSKTHSWVVTAERTLR